MKKLIFLTLFLSISPVVYAQDSQNQIQLTQTKSEIEQKIEEKKILLQTQINERREEIKNSFLTSTDITKLQITAQERVSKAISVVFERMNAFIIRYDGIIQRLEARIATMDSGDAKIEAERLLQEANMSLLDTTTLIIATENEIKESLNTKTSLKAIKANIALCKESLKQTHDALVLVIKSIKATDIEDTLATE